MPQEFLIDIKSELLTEISFPGTTVYNRLEGRLRKEDFDRSLRAEVRDPLWMLCRQWQFGEFKGEDAGSAVKARVQLDTTRLSRFAVRKNEEAFTPDDRWENAVPYNDQVPLEAIVEREKLISEIPNSPADNLALRAQIGRYWMKLLKKAAPQEDRQFFVEQYSFQPFFEGLEAAHLESDASTWQTSVAVMDRLPDGVRLIEAIRNGEFNDFVNGENLITNKEQIINLGAYLQQWFLQTYTQPETDTEDAWEPPYLEYQCAVSAPDDPFDDGRTTLVAEQYHHGRLEWYSFDIARQEHLTDTPDLDYGTPGFKKEAPITFLPSQIEFNGMPNVRWWEFEDRKTDFGNIRANTTNIPLLMLAEFGLIYGNDWSVLPYDLPVGSLARINGIVVRDVFGIRTFIRPANQGTDERWEQWRMYNLHTIERGDEVDYRMFLPPAVAKIQESEPVEKVIFTRDEMANMVWGIEDVIPGVSGKGINGFEAAVAVSKYYLERVDLETQDFQSTEAKIRYLLGNTVPENWIPFIARHIKGSNREIRLQRASMPRLTDAVIGTRVEPRGRILREGLDQDTKEPYFIHEEEISRAGIFVRRSFQRTRWFNGKTYLWMGRQKQVGRGEGSSGLAFDQIIPIDKAN